MGANDLNKLELSVGRWGNSLAVRLPAELARQLGVGEGGTLQVERNADQSFTLSARSQRKPFDKATWQAQMQAHLASMPPSESVIREMRDGARY
ncbi:MAG: AbrB/MazE/SpoVT family DNA-binding domain-containing protein [Pseudomonadota bacterium]|nr:AbrB/MazE/SpoVT family DNA-binding domain-containing protein [Pseudomonadota bacterium]